jgi:hypothetical protein
MILYNQYDYEEDGTYCYPGTNVLNPFLTDGLERLLFHDIVDSGDGEEVRGFALLQSFEITGGVTSSRNLSSVPQKNAPVTDMYRAIWLIGST